MEYEISNNLEICLSSNVDKILNFGRTRHLRGKKNNVED